MSSKRTKKSKKQSQTSLPGNFERLEPRQMLSSTLLTTYPIPNSDASTWSGYGDHIIAGPDGSFWFTDQGNNAIGKVTADGVVTEYALPTHDSDNGTSPDPSNLVVGADGDIWFTESNVDRIGRITADGTISEFTTPTANSNPNGLAASGNYLWFGESNNAIGRISMDGSIKEFALGNYSVNSGDSIASGGNGDAWFIATDDSGNYDLGHVDAAGNVSFQQLSDSPNAIALGSDGNLWLATDSGIDRIAPDGTTTTFNLPADQSNDYLSTIVAGADGNLYALASGNDFDKITTAGVVTEYSLPSTDSSGNTIDITDLAQASDGRFWYADANNPEIGVIDLTNALLINTNTSVTVTAGSSQTSTVATFTDLSGSSDASDYTATVTLASADSTQAATVLPATIVADPNGGFDVNVTNTWKISSDTATVTVTDTRDTTRTATGSVYIDATAPQATGTGVDVTATAGQTFTGLVATFTNVDVASLSSYSASIDWGDGHVSAGTITANSSGGFDVTGSNAYAANGSFDVTTTLYPFSGGIFPGGPIIDPLPIATPVTGVTVPDSNVVKPLTGVIATTTPTPILSSGGSGHGVTKAIAVDPIIFGGDSATATSTATVSAGVMTGVGYSVQASSTTTFSDTVAQFTLTDPNADSSHFHATVTWSDPGIHDWFWQLSNSPSDGVITNNGDGTFNVSTTANFSQSGLFHFVVTITDDRLSGSAATVGVAYGQVVVDSPNSWLPVFYANAGSLTPTGSPVPSPTLASGGISPTDPVLGDHVKVTTYKMNATAGQTFNGNVAALFGLTNTKNLTGTIHWGDGTSSPASFGSDVHGKVIVRGTHVFAGSGAESVTLDVVQSLDHSNTDPLSLPTIKAAAKVAAAPSHSYITTGGIALSETAGVAFSTAVASFKAPTVPAGATVSSTVWWGDGTHSAATVKVVNGVMTVTAGHTYKKAGKYKITTQVIATLAGKGHPTKYLAIVPSAATVS